MIIERLNIWPILATPSVPQPATCRGRQVEGWILAEMWPSSVQYLHAILRMCAFAFAASMIRSNGPPWSDLQALKLLCGSNEHWPTLFSSLVDLIWTLRSKNGQDQLYYFTLCYWKLHAAQVQFLNRRICMPSLGTCSMSSARYHSEWVWVTSPWTTWPTAMPPSGKTVWHPKSHFRGFASSCWCSNDWDALLDWAYYSKPYKDTQTSQSPSCCRLCSVVNPPARPACLLFQCGWQKGRATAWRPGSSLQGYRIYRFYIHLYTHTVLRKKNDELCLKTSAYLLCSIKHASINKSTDQPTVPKPHHQGKWKSQCTMGHFRHFAGHNTCTCLEHCQLFVQARVLLNMLDCKF